MAAFLGGFWINTIYFTVLYMQLWNQELAPTCPERQPIVWSNSSVRKTKMAIVLQVFMMALYITLISPLILTSGAPEYGRIDFNQYLDPVGTAITTCHDVKTKQFCLEKLHAYLFSRPDQRYYITKILELGLGLHAPIRARHLPVSNVRRQQQHCALMPRGRRGWISRLKNIPLPRNLTLTYLSQYSRRRYSQTKYFPTESIFFRIYKLVNTGFFGKNKNAPRLDISLKKNHTTLKCAHDLPVAVF